MLPHAKHFFVARCHDIETDLTMIALRLNNANVESAVLCMVKLSVHITHHVNTILALSQKCYGNIYQIVSLYEKSPHSGLNQNMVANMQRCLIVLGFICEHSNQLHGLWQGIENLTNGNSSEGQRRQLNMLSRFSVEQVADHFNSCKTNMRSSLFTAIGGLVYGPLLSGMCYAVAVYILLNLSADQHAVLHTRAVQVLCSIFVGNPSLLIHCDSRKLLHELFDPENIHYSDSVHERLLISLKRMLDTEESRLETRTAQRDMLSDVSTGVGSGAKKIGNKVLGIEQLEEYEASEESNTNAGFVLQQHLDTVLHYFSQSKEVKLRLAALQLVGTLLRQGLVCPLDVLPALVACQGDHACGVGMVNQDFEYTPDTGKVMELRQLSLRLLQIEDSRHPGFMESRLVEGIEMTMNYQRATTVAMSVQGQVEAAEVLSAVVSPVDLIKVQAYGSVEREEHSVVHVRSCFGSLFSTCVYGGQLSKTKRQDIYSSLLRRCQSLFKQCRKTSTTVSGGDTLNDNVLDMVPLQHCVDTMHKIHYLLTTLAHLPYEYIDDPLIIVYNINRNVSYSSTMFLSRAKKMMSGGGDSGAGVGILGGAVGDRNEGKMQPPAIGSSTRGGGISARTGGSQLVPVVDSTPTTSATSSSGRGKSGMVWSNGLILNEKMAMDYIRQSFLENLNFREELATLLRFLVNLSVECKCLESFYSLKSHLKTQYMLSDEKCFSFGSASANTSGSSSTISSSNEKIKDMASYTPLFQPSAHNDDVTQFNAVITDIENFGSVESLMSGVLNCVRTCIAHFNHTLAISDSDSSRDFNLCDSSRKKRQRLAYGVSGQQAKTKAKIPKNSRKRRKLIYHSDEDDNEDGDSSDGVCQSSTEDEKEEEGEEEDGEDTPQKTSKNNQESSFSVRMGTTARRVLLQSRQ